MLALLEAGLAGDQFGNASRLRGGFLKPWMDKALPELLALAALAAFGCGLALAQDDFAFAAIFAVESALIIVEALRRLR